MILPTYGEFVVLFFILAAFTLIVDSAVGCFRRRAYLLRPYQLFFTSVAVAVVLLGGFGLNWLHNVAFTRFGDIRLAGWMQPRWATAIDILGYSDMYAAVVRELLRQTYRDVEWQVIGNVLVLSVVGLGIMTNRGVLRACWSVVPVFVAIVYAKTRFIDEIHNYQYMKSYTMVGPILFLLFAGCLLAALGLDRHSTMWRRTGVPVRWRQSVVAVILLCPALLGVQSLRRFHTQGHFLSLEDLAIPVTSAAREVLSRHVIVTPGTTPHSVSHHSLAFHFRFHWLRDMQRQELSPYHDWPVAVYLDSDTTPSVDRVKNSGGSVVVRTGRFLVLDTGLSLADVLTSDGREIDWSRIGSVIDATLREGPS